MLGLSNGSSVAAVKVSCRLNVKQKGLQCARRLTFLGRGFSMLNLQFTSQPPFNGFLFFMEYIKFYFDLCKVLLELNFCVKRQLGNVSQETIGKQIISHALLSCQLV